MNNPKIGLLFLYLKLYDDSMPERRAGMDEFYDIITEELKKRGFDVVTSPACRLEKEFRSAISGFEKEKVSAIVTLHLAYSPSLESADALSGTDLPVIVLDTTPDYEFDCGVDMDRITYNHGIHGVMDMCNLLKRNGKRFLIEAGHWRESDVLDRLAGCVRAAGMAGALRKARAGLIGEQFKGMGDFAVPFKSLKKHIGIEVVKTTSQEIASFIPDPGDPDVKAEISHDLKRFDAQDLDPAAHVMSVRSGLAVRRWIEKEGLTAFSMNFLSIDKASGLEVVPFLEASKAMSRGIGYAGEGDVLTASFVGAVTSTFPETTFTEMFCPDWKNGSIFLSHMGEVNVDLIAEKPKLITKPFPWTDADDPVTAVGRLKQGDGVFADLAPDTDDTFTLILVPGSMMDIKGEDRMADTVHGWFRPEIGIEDCLRRYSLAGGTHHSAFVYGNVMKELMTLGEIMGWNVVSI